MTDTDELKREKARNMRYKRSALSMICFELIESELQEISDECSTIQWFEDDNHTLLDALDGDSEQEYEFRVMFTDLASKCELLYNAIYNNYVTEYFDDFFVGLIGNRYNVIGYDGFEEDYFSLTSFETELAQTESGKRLMKLTKKEFISVCGQCLGIAISFFDIQHKYDYLKATFDLLKNENASLLKMVKDIDDAYNRAEKDGFYFTSQRTKEFDSLVDSLPKQAWLE